MTSVGRSYNGLASKGNFSTFFQVNFLNFGLKLCGRPYSYQNFQRGKF